MDLKDKELLEARYIKKEGPQAKAGSVKESQIITYKNAERERQDGTSNARAEQQRDPFEQLAC